MLYVICTGLMATPLLQIQGAQRAQTSGNLYSFLVIHGFSKNYLSARQLFHLNSSLLQMTIVLHPSRIRHSGDTCADVQQGPVPRILFRLRPCVNLFYCLLLITSPGFFLQPRRRLASWHVATPEFCAYLDTRGFLPRAFV